MIFTSTKYNFRQEQQMAEQEAHALQAMLGDFIYSSRSVSSNVSCDWREEHHDKTKDTAGKPDPHSLLGKLMKVWIGNRCSKVWVGLWYISWFNIYIWYTYHVPICRCLFEDSHEVWGRYTEESKNNYFEVIWEVCAEDLETSLLAMSVYHPSSQNSPLSFLCQNNVDKGAGKVHRHQNGGNGTRAFDEET